MIPLKWFAALLAAATLVLLFLIRVANGRIRDLHDRRVEFRIPPPPDDDDPEPRP